MPAREQLLAASTRRGERQLVSLGDEIRHARTALGMTQRQVGAIVHMSQSKISRIEAGKMRNLTVVDATRVAAAVGLDLSVKAYASSRRTRDAPQWKRLKALLDNVGPPLAYRLEFPLPSTGPFPDQRAWDAWIYGGGLETAVELEVRLYDLQAQLRRVFLKKRDGRPDRLLLVVADTRANRRVLAEHADLLSELPRLSARAVIAALRAGQHPLRASCCSRPAPVGLLAPRALDMPDLHPSYEVLSQVAPGGISEAVRRPGYASTPSSAVETDDKWLLVGRPRQMNAPPEYSPTY